MIKNKRAPRRVGPRPHPNRRLKNLDRSTVRPLKKTTNPNYSGRKSTIAKIASSSNNVRINIARLKPGVGDILMLTPALLGLREKFPNAEIVLTVRSDYQHDTKPGSKNGVIYDSVRFLPYVDHVEPHENRKHKPEYYEYFVDISSAAGEIREESPGRHSPERVDIFSSFLGVEASDKRPYLHIPLTHKQRMLERLRGLGYKDNQSLVVIGQNTNTWLRDLPAEVLMQFCAKCAVDTTMFPVVFSELFLDSWNINGLTELRGLSNDDFFALLGVADVIVTPDTGTLHAAGALNKRIVSYWGPTHPGSRTSYYKNISNIWHKHMCPKSPCWYSQQGCQNRVCFNTITADELYSATKARIAASYEPSIERKGSVSIVVGCPEDLDNLIHFLKSVEDTRQGVDMEVLIRCKEEQLEALNVLVKKHSGISKAIVADSLQEVISVANRELILLMHPDMFVTNGWIKRLLTVYNTKENVGIVGGLLRYPNNTVEHGGFTLDKKTSEPVDKLRGTSYPRATSLTNPLPVDAVSDACLLISKEDIFAAGSFVSTFELCAKIKATGKQILVATNTNIEHKGW